MLNTKHDVTWISARVPLNYYGTSFDAINSVHIEMPCASPISGEEAFDLAIAKVTEFGLEVRHCGLDNVEITNGVMRLSIGT